MSEESIIKAVASAIWKQRVETAAKNGVDLSIDNEEFMIAANSIVDEARAAIEAYEAAAWQDISTAPRDGTEFLGYDVRTEKMDVCNFDRHGHPQAVQADNEYGPSEDQFGFDHQDIKFWMSLPTPPSSQPKPEPHDSQS